MTPKLPVLSYTPNLARKVTPLTPSESDTPNPRAPQTPPLLDKRMGEGMTYHWPAAIKPIAILAELCLQP